MRIATVARGRSSHIAVFFQIGLEIEIGLEIGSGGTSRVRGGQRYTGSMGCHRCHGTLCKLLAQCSSGGGRLPCQGYAAATAEAPCALVSGGSASTGASAVKLRTG